MKNQRGAFGRRAVAVLAVRQIRGKEKRGEGKKRNESTRRNEFLMELANADSTCRCCSACPIRTGNEIAITALRNAAGHVLSSQLGRERLRSRESSVSRSFCATNWTEKEAHTCVPLANRFSKLIEPRSRMRE